MSQTLARKHGFTLIELLVVISIIALLIGILLPALGAARRSAQGLVCQTHMKNISTAHVTYSVDYDGLWPGWARVKNPTIDDSGAWVPYADLRSPTVAQTEDLTKGAIYPYMPDLEVLKCPSDPYWHLSSGLSYSVSNHIYRPPTRDRSPTKVGAPNFPENPAQYPQHNVEPGIAVFIPGTTEQIRFPNSDKFVQPSNLIAFVDEGGPGKGLFPENPSGNDNTQIGVNDGLFQNLYSNEPGGNNNFGFTDKTKWYHSDAAAFGFADGHGELRKRDDQEVISYYLLQQTSTGRYFPYGRIWDPAAQAPEIASR